MNRELKLFLGIICLSLTLTANDLQWPSNAFAIWPLRTDFTSQTAVVSWSDWLVFFNANNRETGVRMILNEMAASGIRNVWWRTFGGGHALYSSQVDGVTTGNYAGQGADYSTFNCLAEAVSYGHKLGLKVYAWYTPLEEAHGWAMNVRSVYTDAHPEMSDYDYNGRSWQTPSMYYPEYRAYKLALGKEMLDCGVDGMVIDFERLGAPVRSNNWGYIPALLKEYNEKYGLPEGNKPANDDPQFLEFRAEFVGKFMREMAAETHKRNKNFAVMYLDRNGRGPFTAHCNVDAWYKEGFIDNLCVTNSWDWNSVTSGQLLEAKDKFGIMPWPIQYNFYGSNKQQLQQARMLNETGVDNIIWFETTYFHSRGNYSVARELGCEDSCEMISPEYDFAGGGTLHVYGESDWTLLLNGRELASGKAGQTKYVEVPSGSGHGSLVLKCVISGGKMAASTESLHPLMPVGMESDARFAGVGLFGTAVGEDGVVQNVVTGRDWKSDKGVLQTVALMGVPPFLAPFDKEVR